MHFDIGLNQKSSKVDFMRLNLPAGPSCKFVRLDQRPDRLDTEWQQGCDPLGSRSRRTCERNKNVILQLS